MNVTRTDTTLRIEMDAEEVNQLQMTQDENPDSFQSDQTLWDLLLEPLTSNSDLDTCDAEEVGAMTQAPLLCERETVQANDAPGPEWRQTATGMPWTEWSRITRVWGYAPYELRSPLDDLLATGTCIFQSSF